MNITRLEKLTKKIKYYLKELNKVDKSLSYEICNENDYNYLFYKLQANLNYIKNDIDNNINEIIKEFKDKGVIIK